MFSEKANSSNRAVLVPAEGDNCQGKNRAIRRSKQAECPFSTVFAINSLKDPRFQGIEPETVETCKFPKLGKRPKHDPLVDAICNSSFFNGSFFVNSSFLLKGISCK